MSPHNAASVAPETTKRGINPVLIVMLAALAIYPFIVGLLPEPVRQYLGSLFR